MEELELKHLAPYLPYNLKISTPNGVKQLKGIDISNKVMLLSYWIEGKSVSSFAIDVKPILRPLSDLPNQKDCWNELYEQCKNIDENLDYLPEFTGDLFKTSLSYKAVSILIMWHFDVFGLIEKGLAKNILELETETLNKAQK